VRQILSSSIPLDISYSVRIASRTIKWPFLQHFLRRLGAEDNNCCPTVSMRVVHVGALGHQLCANMFKFWCTIVEIFNHWQWIGCFSMAAADSPRGSAGSARTVRGKD
jgi:hypothetical protein